MSWWSWLYNMWFDNCGCPNKPECAEMDAGCNCDMI